VVCTCGMGVCGVCVVCVVCLWCVYVCVYMCVWNGVCVHLGSRGQLLLCLPPGQARTQKGACMVKGVGDTRTHGGALGTAAVHAFSFAGLLASETPAALF